MANRQYLEAGSTIQLTGQSDGKGYTRTFTIEKRISEGAYAVCYQARHGNSGDGVLKEFYPKDADTLKRDKHTKQLVRTAEFPNAQKLYADAEETYIEPYELLLEKERDNNQDLSKFIPAFEIYHGCDENGNAIGSVYIWTPNPAVETFDKICMDIHQHPERTPEKNLFLVLNAIRSLTECIMVLHSAGFVDRDITPFNFGFQKVRDNIKYQDIELFDINTIWPIKQSNTDKVGTPGFMEPECGKKTAINKTDIYSIGATLFYAVIVNDEVKKNNYVYQQDYYDRLHELVRDSELIKETEANSHPFLIKKLTDIFQRSLCSRRERYDSCEDMLKDIDEALFYVAPKEITSLQRAGRAWRLVDVEKSLDINKEKDSTLAIQYHLYEYPLYKCVKETENSINVLVIGFGNYGQKFLDACLQAGQIRNKSLNIVVISENDEDKDTYLIDRPELSNFFNIDGSLDEEINNGFLTNGDIYGKVSFYTKELHRENIKANATILQDIMCQYIDADSYPHYTFIALGEDELNSTAAGACMEAVNDFGWDCTVNYVLEGRKDDKKVSNKENMHPLYINEDIKKSPMYKQIERMAFNAHLVWEKDLDIDFNNVKRDFNDPYNHDSSVANVLSLKYKLHSIGIDLDQMDYDQAAKEYDKKFSQNRNNQLRNDLIWVEHRRWVTEKVCQGWVKREVSECKDGDGKDKERKRHVCIVRSRPDQILEGNDWDYTKWNSPSRADLDKLDELDRMSVDLHLFLMKEATSSKRQDFISEDSSIISDIRSLIEDNSKDNKDAIIAFQEWYACVKDICNDNEDWAYNINARNVHLYEGLKEALFEAIDYFPDDKKKLVKSRFGDFEEIFKPILESMRYRIWKQDDVALIDNIPFILTYSENIHMVIPYLTGDKEIFGNVAAPTVVNPKKVTYFYYVEDVDDLTHLCKSIPGIVKYLEKKKIRSNINFILVHEIGSEYNKYDDSIIDAWDGKIRKVTHISGLTKDIACTIFEQRFTHDENVVVEENESSFSQFLTGKGFYEDLRSYELDVNKIKFKSLNSCEMFNYINKKPYFTVAEMFALTGAHCEHNSQPEFYEDYMDLWDKYCENKDAWKSLGRILKQEFNDNKRITIFNRKDQKSKDNQQEEEQVYNYITPFSCARGIKSVLDLLKAQSILIGGDEKQGYTYERYSSDSCKFTIWDTKNNHKWYDKLFSSLYAFMIPDAVSTIPPVPNKDSETVAVNFNSLIVTDAKIEKKYKESTIELLNYLNEEGYIIDLNIQEHKKVEKENDTQNDNKLQEDDQGKTQKAKKDEEVVTCSFVYGSKQIKELLTQEGKIFEVYIYSKLKTSGYFDDVVSGYEIRWDLSDKNQIDENKPNNEFDCIVTKGFRSLFIECKARPNLEPDFYQKLEALVPVFGVNAKSVIIADTEESRNDRDIENDRQRMRGDKYNFITIYGKEEIDHIDDTIKDVFNDKYNPNERS